MTYELWVVMKWRYGDVWWVMGGVVCIWRICILLSWMSACNVWLPNILSSTRNIFDWFLMEHPYWDWEICFLTGISTSPNYWDHVILRCLCSSWLRLGPVRLGFRSGLPRSAHPSHQTSSIFNKGLKRSPSLAWGPKFVPTVHSYPDIYHSGVPAFMPKAFFFVLIQGVLKVTVGFTTKSLGLLVSVRITGIKLKRKHEYITSIKKVSGIKARTLK